MYKHIRGMGVSVKVCSQSRICPGYIPIGFKYGGSQNLHSLHFFHFSFNSHISKSVLS